MGFDLLDDPWIPVLDNATPATVGLRQLLLDAHRWSLAVADPLELVALLRMVLLPILIRAIGYPRDRDEWVQRFEAGSFDAARIATYLDQAGPRFDLFDPTAPFGQVADLEATSGGTRPSSVLQLSVATGNNVPLFSARPESDPEPLTPPRAALALLAVQAWDPAGLKTGAKNDPKSVNGKTTGNPTGSVGPIGVVIPWGRNLFETLLLNLPIFPSSPSDARPPWERPPDEATWTVRPPLGIVDVLTWQSRRCRLLRDADGLVRRVVVTAGDRMESLNPDFEIHTLWRQGQGASGRQTEHRPLRHQSGRALWRGLPALLALRAASGRDPAAITTSILIQQLADLSVEDLPKEFPLEFVAVGVEYGNQRAVIENVIWDSLPFPMSALLPDPAVRDVLLEVARISDDLRVAADSLARDLGRAAGGPATVQGRGEELIGRLDLPVRELLTALRLPDSDARKLRDEWKANARNIALDVAEPLLATVNPAAFLGREDKAKHQYRAATAEMNFRRRLNEVLGPAGDVAGRAA